MVGEKVRETESFRQTVWEGKKERLRVRRGLGVKTRQKERNVYIEREIEGEIERHTEREKFREREGLREKYKDIQKERNIERGRELREKYNDIQKERKTDSISVDKNITKDITNRTLRHQQYSIISLILRISIIWQAAVYVNVL